MVHWYRHRDAWSDILSKLFVDCRIEELKKWVEWKNF